MSVTPIRLRAEDAEDVKIVSACLQDAILPIGNMDFLPEERRFILLVSRFRWETADRPRPGPVADDDQDSPFERVQCGVRVEGVTGVKRRGLDLKDRAQMLELLAITPDEGGLLLTFAGGACLRLEGERLRLLVEDVGDPWPTGLRPTHTEDAQQTA